MEKGISALRYGRASHSPTKGGEEVILIAPDRGCSWENKPRKGQEDFVS